MNWFQRLFTGKRMERDLDSELRFHLEQQVADTIAKSLEGDYRSEHLFALRQSLAAFRYYQELVVEVDEEIRLQLGELKTATTAEMKTPARTKASPYQKRRYEPRTL